MAKNKKERFDVPIECKHCGNTGVFFVKASYFEEDSEDEGFRILQCPTCEKVTFAECWDFEKDDDEVKDAQVTVLYPSVRPMLNNLPSEIEEEFAQATKIQYLSKNGCALQIGRTLEAICEHEGISGNETLVKKIQKLGDDGKIPKQLTDMSQLLRIIRNIGSHFSKDNKVSESDLETAMDFLTTVLEYLYVVPARITALQEKLIKQQAG